MKNVIMGLRIPRKYFITSGTGQSDITVHAGSYDVALREARIHNCNLIYYSSILPKTAERVEQPKGFPFGSVIESITADNSTGYGVRTTAGLGIAKLKRNGEYIGGLVAEYGGEAIEEVAKEELRESIIEMYRGRYRRSRTIELCDDIETITRSFIPKKKHGTAIVALCFIDYVVPIVEIE